MFHKKNLFCYDGRPDLSGRMRMLLYPAVLVAVLCLPVSGAARVHFPAGQFDGDVRRFAAIDQHALAAPVSVEKDLPTLVTYLIEPAKNQLEKARVIWRWITGNIAYDVEGYYQHKHPTVHRVSEVFSRRIAVCAGYAKLYVEMARLAGLKAKYVRGSSRKDIGTGNSYDHAWNSVEIDGRWYLMDATRAAGSSASHPKKIDSRFTSPYKEGWFLVDPRYMVFTHFPEDNEWQLLKTPIGPHDFIFFPRITPWFSINKLWFFSKPEGYLSLEKHEALHLQVPRGIEIKAVTVKDSSRASARIVRDADRVQIFPQAKTGGRHSLIVLGKRADEKKFSVAAFYYYLPKIHVPNVVPTTHGGTHEVRVILPKSAILPTGRELIFRFFSSSTDLIVVSNAGKTWRFEGSENYDFRIPVRKGKLRIDARITSAPVYGKSMKTILEYDVE